MMKTSKLPSLKYLTYHNFETHCAGFFGPLKFWTLFTALALAVNSDDGPERITLKYFISGHTFMSAEVFHREIEKEVKAMGQVCDFIDFLQCVKNAGEAVHMEWKDFGNHKDGLSQRQESKNSSPRLDKVSIIEFQHGSTSMFLRRDRYVKNFPRPIF